MYLEKLKKYQRDIYDLEHIINVLEWDLRVSTPKDETEEVIKLINKLESKFFILESSKEYGSILDELINSSEFINLSIEEQRYINKLLDNYKKRINVPHDFYVSYTEFILKSTSAWEKARELNDYQMFAPYLEKMISYTKKYYSYIGNKDNLYDLMLDSYEAGLTSEVVDKLFTELKEKILQIMPSKKENDCYIKINASKDDIFECAKFLLDYIGFDLNKGVLGNYPHGFTEKVGNKDIRIAFKDTDNALDFVSTIIHEGGHGILEQNVSDKLSSFECLSCDGINALHESQSRFYENMLGRNKNFWVPIYGKVKQLLKLDATLDEFVEGLNNPVLSLIRTEADELTYCMHIILRYEIERDLFSDKITVFDIPKVWNDKMREYLGISPSQDFEGAMQDVHWAEGDFGYFPSYLVGSIYDGVLLEHIEKKLGSVDEILRNGEIKKITKYLVDNIYVNGSAFTGQEVLEKLGLSVSIDPLVKYFYNKYC